MHLLPLLHLSLHNDLILCTVVVIDLFLYEIAKEAMALLPFLLFYIEFILERFRIDDIG